MIIGYLLTSSEVHFVKIYIQNMQNVNAAQYTSWKFNLFLNLYVLYIYYFNMMYFLHI